MVDSNRGLGLGAIPASSSGAPPTGAAGGGLTGTYPNPTVATNANLTGVITSVGNATSIASQTGTGTKFVVDTSPTLVTPNIGAATATTLATGSVTVSDAANIAVGSSTGTKIGTATSQKLGFYNATPIVQPSGDVATALSNLGLITAPTIAATDVTLTTGQIGYGISGLLSSSAGFAVVGTPSATAPSTGTNGPGLVNGIFFGPADGAGAGFTTASYGNSVAQSVGLVGYACQGTAASPGATISGDTAGIFLRGHDGTNFTATQAQVKAKALGTWTPSSRESGVEFAVTPAASTTLTVAGMIDGSQILTWGGGAQKGITTYAAGAVAPKLQMAGGSVANGSFGQSTWNNGTNGPFHYLAKSRSTTIGTQGVITTGDTLGTLSWQGDDGTNFIAAAQIAVTATGTIATTRVPGNLVISTGTDAAPTVMTAAITITNAQAVTVNTGIFTTSNATDASAIGTASVVHVGGVSVAKNLYTGAARVIAVRSVVSAAGTTALAGTDHAAISTGSTTQTFTLPACATGRVLYIKNRSSGNLTVNRAGSDTIDGGTSNTLTQNQSITIIGNGTDWCIC